MLTAFITYRNARRLRKNLPDSESETAIRVVVVVPEEERRYFLKVPPGLSSWQVLDTVANALEKAWIEKDETGPGKAEPLPSPPGKPGSLTATAETAAELTDPDE
ncbi:hypothetical protein, partial [Mycobacterium gordonae]